MKRLYGSHTAINAHATGAPRATNPGAALARRRREAAPESGKACSLFFASLAAASLFLSLPQPVRAQVSVSAQYLGDNTSFIIKNNYATPLTGATITGSGYGGNSVSGSITIPTIAGGGSYTYAFDSSSTAFRQDFDDSFAGQAAYALAGTVAGAPVSLSFSPNNNATGGFVGFLGNSALGTESDANVPATPVGLGATKATKVTKAPVPLTAAYWLGNTNNVWASANWATDAAGTRTSLTPSAVTDVFFSAAGAANQNTALGANFTINTLTVNDPAPVGISGGGVNALTIAGNNAITVNSGAGLLTISANLVLSGTAPVVAVNNTAGALFSGGVSGSGGLAKTGTGALTLTGASTYSGDTNIKAGSLFVDGSIASATTSIQSGALLGGTGTIGGNLINGGTLSPGHSPGTITVAGNYAQSSGGALKIEIGGVSSGQFDLVRIGGAAALGGTLQLVQLNGFQLAVRDKITFLAANGGVFGTFALAINPFSSGTMIGTQVVYGTNFVALEGVQNSFTALEKGVSGSPNQRAVADALDDSVFDPRNARLIDRLDHESLSKVLEDIKRISPDELTSIYQIAVAQSKIQTFNLQRRLDDVRSGSSGFSAAGFAMNGSAQGYSGPLGGTGAVEGVQGPDGKSDKKMVLAPTADNRWGVFVTGTGEWADVAGTDKAAGYDLTSAGFTLGVDYKVTSHFVVGLGAGYARGSADLTGGGRVRADGGKLALYASYFTGGFYADAAVQGGYNSYDTRRAGVDGAARGSTDGGELSVLFGTGYQWKAGGLTFGPTGNFEYTYVGLDSFTERGSLAPLDFPNQHQESLRSTFGAKAAYDWKLGRVLVKPELRAGWQHEYGDATFGMRSSFASGAGPEFLVHGPATGRDSLVVGAGVAIQCSERISTYVYYDGELARANYQAHSVSGGFRFEF